MKILIAGFVVAGSLGAYSTFSSAPTVTNRQQPISIPAVYPDASMKTGAGKALFKGYPVRKKIRSVSAPGVLTESDTEYRLDKDIVAPGTAFVVKASRVTLNLNGHTVTYMSEGAHKEAYGIQIPGFNKLDIAVLNGSIRQGEGECPGNPGGVGCNPVYSYDAKNLLLAGLDVSYHTPDTSGIVLHWNTDAEVCFNTIEDKGRVVNNRHQGVAALEANLGGKASRQKIHHNLVRGARHIGIRSGADSDVYLNEIHGESVVTNSFGLSASGGLLHDNKIINRGVHPIGIWPGNNIKVYGNYVDVQNTEQGTEYGDTGAACLRMTWGNDNVEVYRNSFILNAEENYRNSGVKSWGRAIWVGLNKPEQKALFHDNFISACNSDGKAKAAAIAVVCNNVSSGLEFRNNIVSSNWGNVLLADSYGHGGGYPRFVDNVFIGDSASRTYKTVKSQYMQIPSTGVFISNTYSNGASLDSVDLQFEGTGTKEVSFGWHLTVSLTDQKSSAPIADARVTVTDAHGALEYTGKTNREGMVAADLLEFTLTNSHAGKKGKQKISLTPHMVTIEHATRKVSKSVQVTGNSRIAFEL